MKDNLRTIFEVAWLYDRTNKATINFEFKDVSLDGAFNAADVGNSHAGYTGSSVGIPRILQFLGAGMVETVKQAGSLPEQERQIAEDLILRPGVYYWYPFGDANRDFYFDKLGMKHAGAEHVSPGHITNMTSRFGPFR